MSRICLRTKIPIPRLAQASTSAIPRRLHTTPQPKSAVALAPTPSILDYNPPAARRDVQESLRWKKLQDFKSSLESDRFSRSRVWFSYVDLLNFLRPDEIPLEIHQKVLRRCTTTLAQARYDLVMRMQRKMRIRAVHPHESRFKAIIHNIRQAGHKPSPADYYFVLKHFAAVGQHVGALHVLREMWQVGLERRTKAYELCLRALHRRLTLPCWHEDRPKLAAGISKLVFKLLKEMDEHKVALTSTNVDLCFQIVGEALEDEPFERLMRLAYGIDLAYPDRPPLEFWSKAHAPDAQLPALTPFPFTTSALNNTVEFLGRKGRISKLVQAFEVLTSPLPPGASSTSDSSYMDDADEDFGDNRPEVAPFTPPYAEPNTVTFERLIKWVSRSNHVGFARHYLYQAHRHDRDTEKTVRDALAKEDVDLREVPIPRLMFTSKMLLSVYGLTNREKKLPMMRWTLYMLYKTKHHRRADIIFYRRLMENRSRALEEKETQAALEAIVQSPSASEIAAEASSETATAVRSEAPTESATSGAAPSSEAASETGSTFSASPVSVPTKPAFDPDLHLSILRREYSRLLALERRMSDNIGRTTQRVKERLGRRVWAAKDIYLRSQRSRVLITKEQWRTSVNYRPRRPKPQADPEEVAALGLPNPHAAYIKGMKPDFFTPSVAYPRQQETLDNGAE